MAFTTVTGSNGITSLVGTTGVDTATIVSLTEKVFVGGNTGNDTIVTNLGTGGQNLSDYNVRMGGGDDGFVQADNLLNSFISMDGEVLANDGNDVYTGAGFTTLNSEVVGRGGNDNFTLGSIQTSLFNGNSGVDTFTSGTVTLSNATILGGQGSDRFTIGATGAILGSGNNINGNIGDDNISVIATTLASSTINGGQGSDTIALTTTIDGNSLSGDLGNDILTGSGADDLLFGGNGDDNLTGALGADTLTGGADDDTFIYATGDSVVVTSTTGYDTITDLAATAATGDLLNLSVNVNGFNADGQSASAGVSLAADLLANATLGAAGAVSTIVITGNVAWAGDYIVQDITGDGYTADDTVIAANSVAGITAASIV